MRGFLSRAGHLLGRALVAFGLGASDPSEPASQLPTHAVLLSPAYRKVRRLG